MTRFALLDALEAHALNLEFSANQRVQIHAGDNHIAAGGGRLGLGQIKFVAQRIEDFLREERDLALVAFFEVEKSVAPNAAASYKFQLSDDLSPTNWEDVLPGDPRVAVLTEPDRLRLALPGGGTRKFCRLMVTPTP